MTAPEAGIIEKLVEIARLIEQHRAAIFVLEDERLELQQRLRSWGWEPPRTGAETETAK